MADDMLPKNVEPLYPLHTLQSDVAEALAKENVVKAPVVVEIEKEEKREQEKVEVTHVVRNFGITILCLGIIFASGYGIFSVARQRSKEIPVKPAEVPVTKSDAPNNFVKAIHFSSLELSDRQQVISKLKNEARLDGDDIIFYELNTSFLGLISLISPTVPAEYYRSLTGNNLYGGLSEGNFFVMKFDSYEQAYAGQLAWEKTMGDDLLPLLGGSSSSTASTSLARFEDRIIANHDVRTALDAKGNVLFVYGFYRNNTVIFSRTERIYTLVYEMLLRQNM